MRIILSAVAVTVIWAGSVAAEIVKKPVEMSVAEAMDKLEMAVSQAGATIFARVDHGGGAMKADMELAPTQLLVFGNPILGTPAMQADPLAGLYLPLKVLVYQDVDGQTWLAYESPADTFDGLDIDPGAEFVGKMTGALGKLTDAVAP